MIDKVEAYQMVSISHWGMIRVVIGYMTHDPIDDVWYEDYD